MTQIRRPSSAPTAHTVYSEAKQQIKKLDTEIKADKGHVYEQNMMRASEDILKRATGDYQKYDGTLGSIKRTVVGWYDSLTHQYNQLDGDASEAVTGLMNSQSLFNQNYKQIQFDPLTPTRKDADAQYASALDSAGNPFVQRVGVSLESLGASQKFLTAELDKSPPIEPPSVLRAKLGLIANRQSAYAGLLADKSGGSTPDIMSQAVRELANTAQAVQQPMTSPEQVQAYARTNWMPLPTLDAMKGIVKTASAILAHATKVSRTDFWTAYQLVDDLNGPKGMGDSLALGQMLGPNVYGTPNQYLQNLQQPVVLQNREDPRPGRRPGRTRGGRTTGSSSSSSSVRFSAGSRR